MRALLFLFVLGLSGAASAQRLTLDFAGQSSRGVSPSDCGTNVAITWTGTSGGTPCSDIQIWVTSSTTCGDAPATGDKVINNTQLQMANWPTQRTGTVQVAVADLPAFTGTGEGATTCGSEAEVTMQVCGAFKYASFGFGCTSTTTVKATPPTLRYDGKPPPAPTMKSVTPLDSALLVEAEGTTSDTAVINLEYRALGETGSFTSGGAIASTSTSARIGGLRNGVTYEVRAWALDTAGNEGPRSGTLTGAPIQTNGFFQKYKGYGGAEQGGCAAAGGSVLGLSGLLLTGFFFSRRRRG